MRNCLTCVLIVVCAVIRSTMVDIKVVQTNVQIPFPKTQSMDMTSALDLNPCPAEPGNTVFANSVDPDQLASEEAN